MGTSVTHSSAGGGGLCLEKPFEGNVFTLPAFLLSNFTLTSIYLCNCLVSSYCLTYAGAVQSTLVFMYSVKSTELGPWNLGSSAIFASTSLRP